MYTFNFNCFFSFCIRFVELDELAEFIKNQQAELKTTERFSVSPNHSWLNGVMVRMPGS